MRIRYTLRSLADLEDIHAYLKERAPAAAQTVISTIRQQVEWLGEFPYMARATERPGVHVLTLTRYPYRIYYLVGDDEVRILHIRHTRRRPLRSGRR
jgi:plasmid stabilization system protein ParE